MFHKCGVTGFGKCHVCHAGVKLAQGKRVVTEKDFIVDDSDVEYETASSAGSEESEGSGPSGDGVDAGLEDSWMGWAAGEAADQKLRDALHSTGVAPHQHRGASHSIEARDHEVKAAALHRILVGSSTCMERHASESHEVIATILLLG